MTTFLPAGWIKQLYLALRFFLLLNSVILLASCQKDTCEPSRTQRDYYPTTIGSRWTYSQYWRSKWDTSSHVQQLEALADTMYEGKLYTYFGLQLIRKENGNYYRRTNFYGVGEEYLFLKDNVPASSTWTHSSFENHKAVFTIRAIHRVREVNGVIYRDVIEVQKQDFYKYEVPDFRLTHTGYFFYAKNIGEIYSTEDHHDEHASDIENSLIDYSIR